MFSDSQFTGIKVALLLLMIVFLYLFMVTFVSMPDSGADMAKTIVPFLLGSVVGTLIGFYWGNKKKEEPTPVDSAAIDAAKVKAEQVVAEAKVEPAPEVITPAKPK